MNKMMDALAKLPGRVKKALGLKGSEEPNRPQRPVAMNRAERRRAEAIRRRRRRAILRLETWWGRLGVPVAPEASDVHEAYRRGRITRTQRNDLLFLMEQADKRGEA